jgi:ribosome-associated protein
VTINTARKVRLIVQAAEDMKAEEIAVLDLRGISTFTDYFLLASVHSTAQRRAVTREIRKRLHEAGESDFRLDGENSEHWTVMDLNEVIVHLFDPPTRDHYRLEALWGDAQTLDAANFLTA